MTEIQIESGVRLPKPRVVFAYPYAEMDVGDSFVVPVDARRKVLNANCKAAKKYGYKFSARTEGDVIRVWRIA